jgi:hypothetical protein
MCSPLRAQKVQIPGIRAMRWERVYTVSVKSDANKEVDGAIDACVAP